jgi:predicted GH43/DUF377 family glycosyl hydrolase
MAEKDGLLYIYYGGADTVVGVATIELDILLRALTRDMKNIHVSSRKKASR